MEKRLFSRVLTAAAAAVTASAVFGVGWAQVPVLTGESGPSVNVRDYGATGDGVTNDTAAIQRANDAVALQGGGTVLFPAGTYLAMGVKQDSNTHLVGSEGATLKHLDGTTSGTPIVQGRTTKTTGSIQADSRTLSVSSTKRFVPGAVVGVRGAGSPSAVQVSTLTSSVTATDGEFVLESARGWRVNTQNFVLVDEEIVGYTGMSGSTLLNVRRGLFGSTAAVHEPGAHVAQVKGLYARITSVGSGTVELDRPALRGVTGAEVWVGVLNAAVSQLTIDGNKPSGFTGTGPVALVYGFARSVRVENNTIRNVAHGAVTLDQGTADSVIANNELMDTGVPEEGSGSAVWLYRGATTNTVQDNTIGGSSNYGVAIDDRTEISTEWDASSDENLVQTNTIDTPPVAAQAAIFVSGSNRNDVTNNDITSTKRGITIAKSTQGTNPGDSEGNSVHDNRFTGHSWGLHATGSYNTFARNVIALTYRPIVDTGVGNTYEANVVVETPVDPTPSPTSEATPTPEPTAEVTPSPTPEVTPEPTPEPTPTPAPTPAPAKRRHTAPVGTIQPTKLSGGLSKR